MKKAIVSVFAAVCVVGGGASAQGVSIPWSSSFEDLPAGSSITNDLLSAWGGDGQVSAVVTNLPYTFSAYVDGLGTVSYPLNTNHTQVVKFWDGGITNVIADNSKTLVYVDVMLQPVRMEQPAMSASIANSQMSLFIDTNGLVEVYHTVLTGSDAFGPRATQWTVLDSLPPIASNQWVRLTVTMDYNDSASAGVGLFQVYVNGLQATNVNAFQNLDPFIRNGTQFVCANSSDMKMHQVAFSGSGMFDDMVVTDAGVQLFGGVTTINASAGLHGTINPSGMLQFASAPATTNFTITADPFWHIATVTTGAVSTAGAQVAAAQSLPSYGIDMTVLQSSYITATFAPDMAANNTPKWWLNQYGLTNSSDNWDAQALADTDGDGAANFQEFVAGTVPTDSNSVLKLVNEQVAGNSSTIQWLNSTSAIGPYVVSASSNLTTWSTVNGTIVNVSGTNSLSATASAAMKFYRVGITNYPTN